MGWREIRMGSWKRTKMVVNALSASLNFGTFKGYVAMHVGNSHERFMKALNKEWRDVVNNEVDLEYTKECFDLGAWTAMMRMHNGRTYFFLILTTPFDFSDYAMVKLAHEIVHLCQFRLRKILDRDVEI